MPQYAVNFYGFSFIYNNSIFQGINQYIYSHRSSPTCERTGTKYLANADQLASQLRCTTSKHAWLSECRWRPYQSSQAAAGSTTGTTNFLLSTTPNSLKFSLYFQRYLDNSTHGAIYFSLGTYIHSTDIPSGHIKILLNAFAKLKQNVLWKYENATIGAELPPNVRISKWLPQNDIFAHANIKLIITHGGIFSTQEGVYWGIPLLFIPIFGDQHRNARKAVHAGYARSLLFDKLTSDNLVHNIQLMVNDSKYKRKALEASRLFRDNPIQPLEEATYWIEYVLKHRGAPHLKSHSAYMSLYQYLLLDVLGCTLFSILLITLLIIVIVNVLKNCFSQRLQARDARRKKQK